MILKIFISYSQTDSKPEAEFLDGYLGSNIDNSDVFYDQHIEGGADWEKEIRKKLETCEVFVVILTNSSIRSSAVKKEVQLAKKLSKTIIPCKDKLLPKSWDEMPWELRSKNGVDFETKEELGKNLVFKITPIEEKKTKLEKKKYNEYLDVRYGTFEIESQTLSCSEIFQNFSEEYEEGFNIWRSNMSDYLSEDFSDDYSNEQTKEEDITPDNDTNGDQDGD